MKVISILFHTIWINLRVIYALLRFINVILACKFSTSDLSRNYVHSLQTVIKYSVTNIMQYFKSGYLYPHRITFHYVFLPGVFQSLSLYQIENSQCNILMIKWLSKITNMYHRIVVITRVNKAGTKSSCT